MIQINPQEQAKLDVYQKKLVQITIIKDQKVLSRLELERETTLQQLRGMVGLSKSIRFEVNNSIVPEDVERKPVTDFLDRQNTLYVYEYVGFYLFPKNKKYSEGLFKNGFGTLQQTRQEFKIAKNLRFIINERYIPPEDEKKYQVTQLRRTRDLFLISDQMIQELGIRTAQVSNPPEISYMNDVGEKQNYLQPKQVSQQKVQRQQPEETPTEQPNQTQVTVYYRKSVLQKFIIDPKEMSLLQLREQIIGGSNKRFLYYQLVLLDADEQQPVSAYLDSQNCLYIYDFTYLRIHPENNIFKNGCLNSGYDIQVADLRRQHSIPEEYLFFFQGKYIQKEKEKLFLIRHVREDQDILLLNVSEVPNYQEAQFPEPKDELRIEIVLDQNLLQINMLHKDILLSDVRHFIDTKIPFQFTLSNGKILSFDEERNMQMKAILVDQKALFIKTMKQPQPVKIKLQCNGEDRKLKQQSYDPFTTLFELKKVWRIDRYQKFLFHQRILFVGDEKRPVHEFLDERGLFQCFDFVNFYIQPECIPLKNRLLWIGPGENLQSLRELNYISDEYVFILNKSYVPQEVEDKIKVRQLRIRQEIQLAKIEDIFALGLSRLLPHQFNEVSTLPDCYQPPQQQQQKKK